MVLSEFQSLSIDKESTEDRRKEAKLAVILNEAANRPRLNVRIPYKQPGISLHSRSVLLAWIANVTSLTVGTATLLI